jgi:hypothetical protein
MGDAFSLIASSAHMINTSAAEGRWMSIRYTKSLLALVAAATVAACSGHDVDKAAEAHVAHHGGGHSGSDKAAAELAFLFPGGDHKGWAKFTKGHGHGAQPDTPLVKLPTAVREKLIHQLSLTALLVARYPTVKSAEAAGYRRHGPFVPGMGTHYVGGVNARGDILTDEEILQPAALIYAGDAPDSPLTGFMYVHEGQSANAQGPEGFAGPNDRWHQHIGLCTFPQENGVLDVLGNEGKISRAKCESKGGTYVERTQHMVHVWTAPAYTNPLGVFADRNPAITCTDGSYHSSAGTGKSRCLSQ